MDRIAQRSVNLVVRRCFIVPAALVHGSEFAALWERN
jgi:hypothetical protein